MSSYINEVASYQAEWFGIYCLSVIAVIAISYALAVINEIKVKR